SSRFRTGIILASVVLGVSAVSAVQTTNDGLARGLDHAWVAAVGKSHLQVRTVGGPGFPEATLARIQALPQVALAAPVARKRVFFRTVSGERGFVDLVAVEPTIETQVRSYRMKAGSFLAPGPVNEIITQASWAEQRGLALGSTLELITQDGLTTFRIAGLIAPDEAGLANYGSLVMVSLDTAREAFGMRGRVRSVSLVLRDPASAAQTATALSASIPEGHVVERSEDARAQLESSAAQFQSTLTLFGSATLFAAIFLIFNTVEMTVVQQAQQTGRLRAAGADRSQIFLYFFEHGLVPGTIGSLVGAILGVGVAKGMALWIERTQDVPIAAVEFSLSVFLASVLIGIGAAALSTTLPSLRASRSNPIEMVQMADRAANSAVSWKVVGLGVTLIVASGAAISLPLQGDNARYIQAALLLPLLTGMVFASQGAIPALSKLVTVPFRRFGSPAIRLAARNLTRQVGRTAVTVAGFTVSVSLLIGLAAVVSSSTRAGERFTQSLIPSELVVVSPVDQPPVFVDQFRAIPGVQYASPVAFFPVQSGTRLMPIASVEPEVFGPAVEFIQGSRQSAIAAMESGRALLVPNAVAQARGLSVGDSIPLQTTTGPTPFQVSGIIAHGFPSADGGGTLLMSRADAERYFGQQSFRLLMIQPKSGEPQGSVTERVADIAERYGMSTTTAQEISSQVTEALSRLLALMGGLVGIGLLVGTFGAANTMLINITERTRELAILWAAGMSRAQLQTMTLAEAAMMGLMGGILGTVVGVALSWILVRLAPTPGFEPEYTIPFSSAALGLLVAVLAATLAGVGPARRGAQLAEHQ
ncbi:MAG: putative rane protein, partial [Chloroflexi bacterium]|nr:putative rane protein [Chloroflexota bacterium]